MISQGRLLVCLIAGATALNPPGHDELLRSALNAVIRKQRSLDVGSQEYYNDLHAFKYHGNPDRNLKRERQGDREIDEEEEEIEFLPNETGQLETVGNGFQGLNDKLLERVWMEYLKNVPEDEEPVREPSIFRERERSSSRKRGGNNEQMNIANKILADFFLVKLQDGAPYAPGEMDDEEYLNTLQMLYDRYKGHGRKFYDNEGPVLLDELGNKAALIRDQNREVDENELADRDQDQSVLYLSPAERRNVNGRYPIGRDFGTYRSLVKRYPVTKRSPKMLSTKKEITDPKVAQDLGALFGTQSTDGQNHTHDHDHEHDHNHDHGHDHDHDHDHDHKHDRNDQRNTSEAPKATPLPKGQKENVTKVEKPKSIEVRKKSVDWSQYFGIDRRRKKATFMAGQGTQNQDDEWMLQRYYENMAENLRPSEREYEKDGNERKDKFDQLDSRMLTDSLRYDDSEQAFQKVKDKLIARLAAAYSLEKMRKALSDLRSNLAAGLEAQKAAQAQNNLTWNYRDNGSVSRADDKRSGNLDERSRARVEVESFEEGEACPELAAIERRCKPDTLSRDGTQLLHLPCTMLQICRACLHNELAHKACLGVYALEVDGICAAQMFRKGQKAKEICDSTAFNLSLLQPPASVAELCRSNGNESCLRRYHELRYPYAGGRLNASDVLALQQMDR